MSEGRNSTVFIKFSEPDPELNLREGQVEQEPIFGEEPPVPVFSNRVFDEYHSPTLSIPMFANREFEELHQRSFPTDERPVLSDYINTNEADACTGLGMVKLVDTSGEEILVDKLYDVLSSESNDNVEKSKSYIKTRKKEK